MRKEKLHGKLLNWFEKNRSNRSGGKIILLDVSNLIDIAIEDTAKEVTKDFKKKLSVLRTIYKKESREILNKWCGP